MQERRLAVACAMNLVLVTSAGAFVSELKTIKPGFNLFNKEQDIQLGKEAKAEVEKTKPMLQNPQIDGYVDQLGKKLAKSQLAGDYPYSFQVVKEKTINAFALPGGPIFIHTQTIAAAQNEAQLAGVMAHEISHVALRHGTNQASKSKGVAIAAALAGAAAGNSTLGALTRTGINLGANSALLHYSRDAESQADYVGAQIMSEAGYDPIEMARFFEQLQTKGSEGAIAQFMSDHPTPGNRVKAVESEVKLLPARQYVSDSPAFQNTQAAVRGLQ